jgi:hypothetical protein
MTRDYRLDLIRAGLELARISRNLTGQAAAYRIGILPRIELAHSVTIAVGEVRVIRRVLTSND